MSKIKLDNGEEINSEYEILAIDGLLGFVLESWGPKDRNPEYADAMDTILKRLIENEIPCIEVYVISSVLIKKYPDINDRKIWIEGSDQILLNNKDPKDLRI